jgi:hypothetical protein
MKTIGFVYPTKLSGGLNAREHWAVKAKRVKTHRTGISLLTFSQCNGLFDMRQTFTITLTAHTSRRIDDDNLRSKLKEFRDGVADGIASAGAGHFVRELDDSRDCYRWRYAWKQCKRTETGVGVEIEVT